MIREKISLKNIVLISSVYSPSNISGAIQMRDLSEEFFRQGFITTVMVPCSNLKKSWEIEYQNGVRILRLKSPKIRDIGYFRRTLGEMLLSFVMLRNIKKSPLKDIIWDGIVCYSPTIFFGPLVKILKKKSNCKSYLIVRDIFPEWALDLGLIKSRFVYFFFKFFADYQYSAANIIGVQSQANLVYFKKYKKIKIEVLNNWLAKTPILGSTFIVKNSILAGRTIFVYTGNMGIAQGMDLFIDLAEKFCKRKDVGFLFVGRGTAFKKIKTEIHKRNINNIVLHKEIPSSEIQGLLKQCHVGMVALDNKHKTHNIPGKFLSYMQTGIPVLALINRGNDLKDLIIEKGVGKVCTDYSLETLLKFAKEIINEIHSGNNYSKNCYDLSENLFSPKKAVLQILSALNI